MSGALPSHGRGRRFDPCIAHHPVLPNRSCFQILGNRPGTSAPRAGGLTSRAEGEIDATSGYRCHRKGRRQFSSSGCSRTPGGASHVSGRCVTAARSGDRPNYQRKHRRLRLRRSRNARRDACRTLGHYVLTPLKTSASRNGHSPAAHRAAQFDPERAFGSTVPSRANAAIGSRQCCLPCPRRVIIPPRGG
jgi:hypothetical protein